MAMRRDDWPRQKPGAASEHGQGMRVQTSITTYYEQDQRGASGKFLTFVIVATGFLLINHMDTSCRNLEGHLAQLWTPTESFPYRILTCQSILGIKKRLGRYIWTRHGQLMLGAESLEQDSRPN